MSVIMTLATLRGRLRWSSFQRGLEHPEEAQHELLRHILEANRNTDFGRQHKFAGMTTVADYRAEVPIADYEAFRPWVDRMVQGESDVLTAGQPYMFAVTSGTTGQPKLIPLTSAARTSTTRLTSIWIYRCEHDHRTALDGKALVIVSPAIDGYTPGGTPFGSASGHIYQNASRAVRRVYALPYAVFAIHDYEAKYYTIMRFALEQSVSIIITPNPSTIVRLLATADQHREELIQDIHDGTLAPSLNIESDLRSALRARLRPNPTRARELERIAADAGFLDPRAYWPKLGMIGCWKGGSVGVTADRLRTWFRPGLPFRDIGLLASEAAMSLPISDDGAGGILAVDTNFYEFVPEVEAGSANPQVFTASQLVEGEHYNILLTTPSGLYRYDMNDIVRVVGFYHRTPIVEFARKGRDMVSLTGEKLHVGQLIQAMAEAQRVTGVAVEHYRALGNIEDSCYDVKVEVQQSLVSDEALTALSVSIDEQLARLNIEYDQKRGSGRLGPVRIHLMREGWHQRRRQAKLARGARDAQFKDALLGLPDDDDDPTEVAKSIEVEK